MKCVATVAALAALSSIAAAAPSPSRGDWNDWKDNKAFPFKFTSTYEIVATPDQVVNSTQNIPTPGEPGAIGYYNYGIQSELDLICYVSSPLATVCCRGHG